MITDPYQYMPPLSDEEYAALRADIQVHGIQSPIVVDEDGQVIDGHHRQKIAAELGIDCPTEVVTGLSDSEKRSQSFSRNLVRRHLNREQRRQVIAESLLADPQLSDREHARRTGSSHPTVAKIRRGLEDEGRLESFTSRISGDGRSRPVFAPMTRAEAEASTIEIQEHIRGWWEAANQVAESVERVVFIVIDGINAGWPRDDGYESQGQWLLDKHLGLVKLMGPETMHPGYALYLERALKGGYEDTVTIYGAEVRAAVQLGFIDDLRRRAKLDGMAEPVAPLLDRWQQSVISDLNAVFMRGKSLEAVR